MTSNGNQINEAATPQQVMDAIKKRYEVKMTYAGDESGKGGGQRIIQPVAYGLSKAGNPVIRAFQPFGDTTTKVPHWKLFRLDKIDKWSGLRNRKFDAPPAAQWNAEGEFNPETDKSMSEVYLVADFEGAKERYNDNLRKHNEKVRKDKIEQDPLYMLKRNIKNSIKATPEIMKRIEDWQREQERRKQRQQQSTPSTQVSNAREMASIKDFGSDITTTTSEPITKQNTETPNSAATQQQTVPQTNQYRNVVNNGPIYKGKPQIPDEMEPNNQEQDAEQEQNNLDNEA